MGFLQPFVEAALSCVVVGLVLPIGGEALLSDFLHALAADLYLHPIACLAHHHGVQTFVAVGFRERDPVLQLFSVRAVAVGQHGINFPTFHTFLVFWAVGDEANKEGTV